MAIFQRALNPFGKAFGDMSPSGRNNTYANSIMFNAVGNKLREGRKLAARNNLSYGGVDDNGEHIFAPAGVYQPIQEAAQGIAGLLDVGPPEMLPIPPIDPNLEMIGGPLPGTNLGGTPLPTDRLDYFDNLNPAPPPPTNSQVTDPYFQQPITDDPYQYAQPDTRIPDVQKEPPIFYEDPIIPDPPMVVQGEVPGAGYIEDPMAVGAPIDTGPPIGQPTDTGTNPFYAGATNVAQPPSMTRVAPSFSLDVGVGGYGTPTNTAGFGNMGGMGGFGGFNIPTPTTVPYPTGNYSDQVAVVPNEPQTTTTALPTVNSFAGFNGFGGFGGF